MNKEQFLEMVKAGSIENMAPDYGFVLTASDTLEGALDSVNNRAPAKEMKEYGLPVAIVYRCQLNCDDQNLSSSQERALRGEYSLDYDTARVSALKKAGLTKEDRSNLIVSVIALYNTNTARASALKKVDLTEEERARVIGLATEVYQNNTARASDLKRVGLTEEGRACVVALATGVYQKKS